VQIQKKIGYVFLLIGVVANSNAEILTSRDMTVTVDKSSQTALLNTQLAEFDKLYGSTAALLRNVESHISHQKQNLEKIHVEIKALNVDLLKQNDELSGQIKTMYAMGNKERLKLLLNQENPILSSRMLAYYDYLNARRVNQLSSVTQSLHRLEELKVQNEKETAELDRNLAQKKTEQVAVDSLRKKRAELLKQVSPDILSNEQQLNRLKDSESELKSLLNSLQTSSSDLNDEIIKARALRKAHLEAEEAAFVAPKVTDEDSTAVASIKKEESLGESIKLSGVTNFPALQNDFTALKGELPWPVKGELIQKFGSAREEGKLDGVLIAAPEGTEIQSITDGKIVYADWMRGYGLLIIVDHGKGYISLYAFNQSLYKKVGDVVNAGDVIASVGLSGGHNQASLYFGIRKKGKAVDPMEWCH
jgi:septal ring factor EnvC (AmiA/AmiB activator)